MKKLILIYLLILSFNTHAYIDPGSGSAIITTIIGVFAAVIFTIKRFFYKIKNFFLGKNKKKK